MSSGCGTMGCAAVLWTLALLALAVPLAVSEEAAADNGEPAPAAAANASNGANGTLVGGGDDGAMIQGVIPTALFFMCICICIFCMYKSSGGSEEFLEEKEREAEVDEYNRSRAMEERRVHKAQSQQYQDQGAVRAKNATRHTNSPPTVLHTTLRGQGMCERLAWLRSIPDSALQHLGTHRAIGHQKLVLNIQT